MRRLAILFPVFFLLAGCAQQPSAARHVARIEQHLLAPDYLPAVPADHASIADRLAYYKVPGVSVAVINDGKVEWAKGYGIADVETKRAVDERTLFHGASLSKPVNAITFLIYVQQHKVDLDKPVNEQLSGWKLPDNEWTAKLTADESN